MSGPDPVFQVIASQHHYSGWVINVHTDDIQMPDGSVGRRDIIDHPGAVAIVALDDEDNVVMVRQYRPALKQHLLELPAGLLDVDGEPALAAAKRELAEETSLQAGDWAVLVDLYTSPGMTDEAIRIYLARDLSAAVHTDDFAAHGEEVTMTVLRLPLTDLAQQVLAGELVNGPAVAGVLAAERAKSQQWSSLRPADAFWSARPSLAG